MGLRGAGIAPRVANLRVALGERVGQAGRGGKANPACTLHALYLRFPPPQPVLKSLLCCWVFPPLLIPNQEIKGRQRLRLFPLCRELESSGRGNRPLPDRFRAGGHMAQVEGGDAGGHPGSRGGGSRGHAGAKAQRVLRGGLRCGGPGSHGSGGRLSAAEEEEGWG